MTVYVFDGTMDGLLTAVFDAYALKEQPEELLKSGDALPLFCERRYQVATDEDKAQRVWTGLEKRLEREALKLISVSWLSELQELSSPLFHYIYKVFKQGDISRNFADPDVLSVTNIARRVLHEQLRMKQFIRFQKAKDGTYLAVVAPDHNVLPLITDHFSDRFNDQPWLIYDAKRHYGYYYEPTPSPSRGEGSLNSPGGGVVRITFEDETAVPFDLSNGKMDADILSSDDQLFQDLWRTYFKAICIKERVNPKKQLSDMPRRYWKYMTEKQ
jgi:probable DNA metabolism protein